MKKYEVRVMLPALVLAAIVMLSFGIADALAQCGGNSGNMHSQHMGYSGQMSSGQMGMHGTQAPVQPDSYAIDPSYVTPIQPPVSGYMGPQNSGGRGQMTGQGGMGSGHDGRMGH
jgi:hypothetical protein